MAKGELVVIPLISGDEEDVEVALVNATFQVRNDPKHKYPTYTFPHPDFGFWLVTEIFKKQKFIAPSEGFYKTFVCTSCQATLDPESQAKGTIEFDLKFPSMELTPFQLRLTLPIVVCENCGKKNVADLRGVYENRISEALLHAFAWGDIKP